MSHLNHIKSKITTDLTALVTSWKNQHQTIVFTNGVFDLLHRGHIEYLAQTADFADKLIVAVNADSSVKKLNKGDSRPLQDENSRALILAALGFVDAVIIFSEDTPFELINHIKPNVLVKGGDYDANCTDKADKRYIVGSDVVKSNSGKVEVIQFVEGYSTSKIEEKIRKN